MAISPDTESTTPATISRVSLGLNCAALRRIKIPTFDKVRNLQFG